MNPAREVKTERPSSKSIPWSRCKLSKPDGHGDVAISARQGATQIDPLEISLWRWVNAKMGLIYLKAALGEHLLGS